MQASIEQVVVLTFYILPGYVALYAADLVVPAPARTTFHTIAWSVILSLAGALVASLWMPPEYLAHLFGSATLSTTALVGTGAQTLSAVGVGGGFALLMKHLLKNRLGQRSAYPTAWDALWSEHGAQRRVVVVEVASGYYAGTLAYADDPRIGRAIVLREPAKFDEASTKYVRTGSDFIYFPADQVRRIELSRVNSPKNSEEPHGQAPQTTTRQHTKAGDQGVRTAAFAERAARSLPGSNRRSSADDAGQLHQSNADREPVNARERTGTS